MMISLEKKGCRISEENMDEKTIKKFELMGWKVIEQK
jgi:hypothetical protein